MIDYRQELGQGQERRAVLALLKPSRFNPGAEADALRNGARRREAFAQAGALFDGLPVRWARKLRQGFGERIGRGALFAELLPAVDWLRVQAGDYGLSRVPLGAPDSAIVIEAERCAQWCTGWVEISGPAGVRAAFDGGARFAGRCGVDAPAIKPCNPDYGGALARLCCPFWWRRNLRAAHAKIVEGGAIRLGFVHRFADCYVSNESVERRAGQNQRNAKTLQRTMAVNDDGEAFTLAELSAKGVANKEIRRGELMLRMRGFEEIAAECGHIGEFVTVTCPSRMHKFRTVRNASGKVVRAEENPSYDGTKPNEAQGYLAAVWARIRAAMKRLTDCFYGFRIAEPNHDGTPHWHMVLFMPHQVQKQFRQIVRRYALADSPNEAGAQKYRVRHKEMLPGMGGAAAYIAKYVAKNIDGYGIEKDLLGNDALTASQRVEAWAATWRIRQFQQIGGAPVGVWRELRRVKASTIEGAPDAVQRAHAATNKRGEGEAERASYAEFLRAMGGVAVPRKSMLLSVARRCVRQVGRYGESEVRRPYGVAMHGGRVYASDRKKWVVVCAARSAAPWTRVNNCTPSGGGEKSLNELVREMERARWKNSGGGVFERFAS